MKLSWVKKISDTLVTDFSRGYSYQSVLRNHVNWGDLQIDLESQATAATSNELYGHPRLSETEKLPKPTENHVNAVYPQNVNENYFYSICYWFFKLTLAKKKANPELRSPLPRFCWKLWHLLDAKVIAESQGLGLTENLFFLTGELESLVVLNSIVSTWWRGLCGYVDMTSKFRILFCSLRYRHL